MYSFFMAWLLLRQNKNLYTSSGLLLTAEILHDAMHLAFPYLDQITKFSPKMQDFKRVLNLNC